MILQQSNTCVCSPDPLQTYRPGLSLPQPGSLADADADPDGTRKQIGSAFDRDDPSMERSLRTAVLDTLVIKGGDRGCP